MRWHRLESSSFEEAFQPRDRSVLALTNRKQGRMRVGLRQRMITLPVSLQYQKTEKLG